MSGVNLKAGSIVSEKENKEIGSTLFSLSNGIQVHYKFVDKNKNDVNLSAVSDGGRSLIEILNYHRHHYLVMLFKCLVKESFLQLIYQKF